MPIRAWFTALLGAIALLGNSGCRDAIFDGERAHDRHLLRGRSATDGRLSLVELDRGRFVSTSEFLLPLEDLLRTDFAVAARIGDDANSEESIQFFAQSESLLTFEPSSAEATSAGFSTDGLPYAAFRIDRLRDQYRTACENSTITQLTRGALGDCNSLDDDFNIVDHAELELLSEEITVRWVAPSDWLWPKRIVSDERVVPGRCCGDFECNPGYECSGERSVTCPAPENAGQCVLVVRECERNSDCPVVMIDGDGDTHTRFGTCREPRPLRRGLPRRPRRCMWPYYRAESDQSLESPVLELTLPIAGTASLDAPLPGDVVIRRAELQFRIQPVPCGGGDCVGSEGVVAVGYRGPSPEGDLTVNRRNIDLFVRGGVGTIDADYRIACEGLGCIIIPIDRLIVHADEIVDRETRPAMEKIASNIARIVQAITRLPRLSREENPTIRNECIRRGFGAVCDVVDNQSSNDDDNDPQTLDFYPALQQFGRLSFPLSRVTMNAVEGDPVRRQAEFGDPSGAFSDNTMQVLARGGDVDWLAMDYRQFRIICGTDLSTPNATYLANCPSGSGVQRDLGCRVCDVCFANAAATPRNAWIDEVCSFIRPPTDDGTDLYHHLPTVNIGTLFETDIGPFPAIPTLAQIFDSGAQITSELNGIFSQPLNEAAEETGGCYRYTRTLWCDESSTDAACLEDSGAVFFFDDDCDGDGVTSNEDNCPEVSNPDQADGDFDGLGNECDNCPCHQSSSSVDQDGDTIPDACDPDLDGDGCNHPEVAPFFPAAGCNLIPQAPWGEAEVFDVDPFGTEVDEDGAPLDTDGTGAINDCDADDDGDGIREVGQACLPWFTDFSRCSDNCRLVANADQADQNWDGLGNVCDPVCDGDGPELLCSPASGDFWSDSMDRFEPAGGLEQSAGIFGENACLLDGPDCWGIETFLCASTCDRYPALAVLTALGDRRFTVTSPAGFTFSGSAAAIADIDGDGVQDLAAGIYPNDCGDASCDLQSWIVAIGSSSGAIEWTFVPPVDASAELGRGRFTMVPFGVDLLVGDPGARDPSTGAVTGAVYLIANTSTAPQVAGAAYGVEGERFGASITRYLSGFLVGAPGADGGKGAIALVDPEGVVYERWYGAFPGDALGSGPMRVAGNSGNTWVVAGSPDALGGAGVVTALDSQGVVFDRLVGQAGERLGSAISNALDPSRVELLIGAPGANGGDGIVYLLGASLTALVAGSPGDHLGAVLTTVGDLDDDCIREIGVSRPGRYVPGLGAIGTSTVITDTLAIPPIVCDIIGDPTLPLRTASFGVARSHGRPSDPGSRRHAR